MVVQKTDTRLTLFSNFELRLNANELNDNIFLLFASFKFLCCPFLFLRLKFLFKISDNYTLLCPCERHNGSVFSACRKNALCQ